VLGRRATEKKCVPYYSNSIIVFLLSTIVFLQASNSSIGYDILFNKTVLNKVICLIGLVNCAIFIYENRRTDASELTGISHSDIILL
jgi:amino acid permease